MLRNKPILGFNREVEFTSVSIAEAYSIISKTARFFSFADTALKIVRMACAVLPCFPITFPKSSLATLSSNTDVLSPFISVY